MNEADTEIWNGHAWALWAHASKLGPMGADYDNYSAQADLQTLTEIAKHAQWLKEHIEALPTLAAAPRLDFLNHENLRGN